MSADTSPSIRRFDAPPPGAEFKMNGVPPLSPQGDIFLEERKEGLGWGEPISIDSRGTEIRDDAITLLKKPRLLLTASLVDVSSIDPTEIQDGEAYAATLELRKKLSLSPDSETPAINIPFALDDRRQISALEAVTFGPLRTGKKLDYSEAGQLIRSGEGPYAEVLREEMEVAKALNSQRRSRGDMTSLLNLERGTVVTGEGRIQERDRADVLPAFIVQETMSAANYALAKIMSEAGVHILYRNQKPGFNDRDKLLHALKRALANPEDTEALEEIHNGLSPVYLSPYPEGNYTSGSLFNAKFSSPGRKLRDFVNMQQAAAFFKGEPLPYTPEQIAAIAEQINRRNRASHVHNINPNKFTHIVRTALEADKLGEHILVEAERRKSNGQLDGEGLSAVIEIHPDKKRADRMRELLAS